MRFVIEGKPVPKGRPRFTRKGVAYTPDQTKAFEKHVNLCARVSQARCGDSPCNSPCIVFITSVFEAPASWPKGKRERARQGLEFMTSKPDIDNLIKAVLDGAQGEGAAFNDDRQVIAVVALKMYGKKAGTLVDVIPVEATEDMLQSDGESHLVLQGLIWKLLIQKELNAS